MDLMDLLKEVCYIHLGLNILFIHNVINCCDQEISLG